MTPLVDISFFDVDNFFSIKPNFSHIPIVHRTTEKTIHIIHIIHIFCSFLSLIFFRENAYFLFKNHMLYLVYCVGPPHNFGEVCVTNGTIDYLQR